MSAGAQRAQTIAGNFGTDFDPPVFRSSTSNTQWDRTLSLQVHCISNHFLKSTSQNRRGENAIASKRCCSSATTMHCCRHRQHQCHRHHRRRHSHRRQSNHWFCRCHPLQQPTCFFGGPTRRTVTDNKLRRSANKHVQNSPAFY